MKIITHTSAVDNKVYKVTDTGTYYHENTSDRIIEVLEDCRNRNVRIQVFYGDIETGLDWCEELGTTGYLGRSMGPIKVTIILFNNRSIGGGALLTNCILKIRETKSGLVLYKAANYQQPVIEIAPSDLQEFTYNTVINGKIHGRHESLKSAELLKKKLS